MAIRQVTRAGVGLVIGIILLAALVFGGLWLVRERGEQARREEAINIADQQLQAESDEGVALNPDAPKGSADESGNATSNSGSSNQANNSGNASSNSATPATELPQTGPEVGSIFVVGIITFVVFSYLRSRKLILE